MNKIRDYATEAFELSRKRIELEAKIAGEIGTYALINYEDYNKVYEIHVGNHKGMNKLADILEMGGNVVHEYYKAGGDDYIPHKLKIVGEYAGEKMELFCYMSDKEYQNYKEEHVK